MVSTRVLSPGVAVVWAAFFNFVAAFVVGTAVAKTIGKGLIEPVGGGSQRHPRRPARRHRLGPASPGIWDCPARRRHALIGGYGGAAIAKAGLRRPDLARLGAADRRSSSSPRSSGMALALGAHRGTLVAAAGACVPGPLDQVFRRLQLLSAALYSLSHGANDAQKTMGIIVGLLVSTQALFAARSTGWLRHLYVPTADRIPLWVEIAAYTAIGLGTALGGWRIVKTMGSRITKLRPFGGFCAETAGGISILIASRSGRAGEHHAHHHRRDRRRRRGAAALGGALGRGHADRVGLDSHHPDERGDRGGGVSDSE